MDVGENGRGIIRRGDKIIVNMRLPGGKKKMWIAADDFSSAKRIVEIIDFYVAGFKALPKDHPDVPGLLEEFRNVADFKQFVLQELQSEKIYFQPGAGVIQSTAAEVPEGSVRRLDRDRGKTEEPPPMPTDAPESSSVCFACGRRGAVLAQITEVVGRLIMDKQRKYVEEMAELESVWRLLRMCAAQEQSCATRGQLPLKTLKEEPHWKHFELAWTSYFIIITGYRSL